MGFKRENRSSELPSSYEHPVVGTVRMVSSLRARRLTLSVRPEGEVRLTLPRGVSQREALRFLDQKATWVQQARKRIAARMPIAQRIEMPFATRSHYLSLEASPQETIRVRVTHDKVQVCYPLALHYGSSEVQAAIRKGIEEAWRQEAQADLPKRTLALSRQVGLTCGPVTIRNSRTRWGSCSANNSISLSLHLMRLPDQLINYIILHELCHTVHKNHGAQFYALLNQVTGGAHAHLRIELKKYTTRW